MSGEFDRPDRRRQCLAVSVSEGLSAAALDAETYDLSEGGFYIANAHELTIGETVTVRIAAVEGEEPTALQCEVAWVDSEGRGARPPGAGLRILDVAPEQKLVATLAETAASAETLVAQHPTWQARAQSSCPRNLVIGWLIEHYHLQTSTFEHMAVAIRRAPDFEIKRVLTKFLYAHRDRPSTILSLLVKAGLDEDAVVRSRPLPQTASCMAHLVEVAFCDLLSYVATVAFGEPRGNLSQAVDVLGEEAASAVPAIVAHGTALRRLGEQVFDLVPTLSRIDQRRARDALTVWYDLYRMLLDGIGSFYLGPECEIPRPPAASQF